MVKGCKYVINKLVDIFFFFLVEVVYWREIVDWSVCCEFKFVFKFVVNKGLIKILLLGKIGYYILWFVKICSVDGIKYEF